MRWGSEILELLFYILKLIFRLVRMCNFCFSFMAIVVNIIALGLANIIGGLFVIGHNVSGLPFVAYLQFYWLKLTSFFSIFDVYCIVLFI